MATEDPQAVSVPVWEHAEWALMYVVLGIAIWTIVAAIVVTAGVVLGVI